MHFAIASDNTRAAVEKVRAAGYEITTEPGEADLGAFNVIYAFFKGPSGELVEFFQTVPKN